MVDVNLHRLNDNLLEQASTHIEGIPSNTAYDINITHMINFDFIKTTVPDLKYKPKHKQRYTNFNNISDIAVL